MSATPAPTTATESANLDVDESASGSSTVRGANPFVAALSSALLLWIAFPPVDRGYFGWVALVPLLLLVRASRSRLQVYLGSFAGGLTFWLLALSWVRLTDPSAWLAWIVMAAFLALWWPGFLALTRHAVNRLRVPLMLAAPVIWVGLEYVRAHVLTGFPWYYLAHTQYRALAVIQIADLAGVWGPSLVIALVNAWVADLLSTPLFRPTPAGPRLVPGQARRLAIVALVMLATLGYGVFRLATAEFRPGPRLALLQSNIEQELKMGAETRVILDEFQRLIAKARKAEPTPDLIVWPETSYPRGVPVVEPGLDDANWLTWIQAIHPSGTLGFWKLKQDHVRVELFETARITGIPMMVGTTTYWFRPDGYSKFNSALLIEPDFDPTTQAAARYDKLHLVPFGEYVPLIEALPWLTRLTPYHGTEFVPTLNFGAEPTWFELNGLRLASVICFEDTVPHVTRRFFAEAPDGRQPDVLVNLSNDGWFRGSSELDMHLAVSVFRCVENRVPLARAVNTGVSAIVDGNGSIRATLPKLSSDVLLGEAPLDDRESVYSQTGDWLGLGCLAVTIGLVPAGHLRARFRRRSALSPQLATSPRLPKAPA